MSVTINSILADTASYTKSKKHVYIINPCSSVGHSDAYCQIYVETILSLGWDVTLLSAKDVNVRNIEDYQKYRYFKCEFQPSILSREYPLRRDGSEWYFKKVRNNLIEHREFLCSQHYRSVVRKYKIKVINKIIKVVSRLQSLHTIFEYKLNKKINLIWRHLKPIKIFRNIKSIREHGKVSFLWVDRVIEKIIASDEKNPDLIFILFMDYFYYSKKSTSLSCNVPWAGILFIPDGLKDKADVKSHNYFKSDNLKGALFLVKEYVESFKKEYASKKCYLIPDITDNSLETTEETKAKIDLIKNMANGRKIILLIGCLKRTKGLVRFIDTAKLADKSRYLFVIAGEVIWNTYTHHERMYIKSTVDSNADNLLFLLGYMKDEHEYNMVFKTADIIYAVYKSFHGGSNTLTKAAVFRRKVIANKDLEMGRVVKSRQLGIASSSNPDEILKSIDKLSEMQECSFKFDEYMQDNSVSQLSFVLKDALDEWSS